MQYGSSYTDNSYYSVGVFGEIENEMESFINSIFKILFSMVMITAINGMPQRVRII
ncbi:hypothetical protein [Lysinibacillus sp. RC79]|uniref:hypothetical protein n=1 Tax=Lysinibacillus sp. RC79 TaxID=3156296 RepID=UPI0035194CEB